MADADLVRALIARNKAGDLEAIPVEQEDDRPFLTRLSDYLKGGGWQDPQPGQRGTFVPGKVGDDGRVSAAVPGILQQPAEGLASLMTAPLGDIVRSGDRDAMRAASEASFDVASMLPAAGVAAGRTMPNNAAGIFGGRLAKTADQSALKRAEDMAAKGAPREQIWNDTGWFKGVDGKWRFEIDDSQAEYLGGVKTARRFDKAIDHPDLAAAYPGLGAAPVRGVKPSEELMGMVAAYNPISREFALRNAPEFDSKTKSSGLHEAQHYIQGEEGFAQGSSEALARGDLNNRAAAAQISAHEAAIADKPTGLRYFSQKAWQDYYSRLADTMTERLRARREAADQPRSRRDILDAYKQSAGEVESRTVQRRMDLSADQRRSRPPWLDYDVPENQQIVRYSNPDDPTTAAILAAMQGQDKPKGITAYHGSPHDFDRFSIDKVGTGQGEAIRGKGLYFGENEGVVDHYMKMIGDRNPVANKPKNYEVRLNVDQSKILDLEQPASTVPWARSLIEKDTELAVRMRYYGGDANLSELMAALLYVGRMSKDEVVERFRKESGTDVFSYAEREVPGSVGDRNYLNDGEIDTTPKSYVVFDDKLVDILKKYSNPNEPTTAAILALLSAQQGAQQDQ